MWQDWALTLAQLFFILSLIPTIVDHEKKPTFSTSFLTMCTVFGVVVIYATLELWFSAAGASVLVLEWATLAVQRWRLDHRA